MGSYRDDFCVPTDLCRRCPTDGDFGPVKTVFFDDERWTRERV
jgi:hypothetical protein